MSIIVLLSPIHFFTIFLSSFNYSSFNDYLPCQKTKEKISRNNFKKDINGTSDPLEMCKNIISA